MMTHAHQDPLAPIRAALWNPAVGAPQYGAASTAYQNAILEQYKLCVEMADRVSQRRGLTNTFFLTLNTAIFTLVGVFWGNRPHAPKWALVFPLVVVLGQLVAWYCLVRSYRQLNSVKFMVVGALEERLPASPYWRAEWKGLGQGTDRSKYWPLSHIETWIPVMFAVIYVAAAAAVLLP